MLPPRWLRRVVLAPAVVLLTLAVLGSLPGLVLLALFVSPFLRGRWRPLRVGWIVVVHLVLESLLLVIMFGLWVASGFGLAIRRPVFERAHYKLMSVYLTALFTEAERVLRLRVRVEGPGPDVYDGRPLVVFCRHAGPGDSFLIADALVNLYDREPRIVLKDTLQWDPMIDVVLNRLPNVFVTTGRRRDGDAAERLVGELATHLDGNDALVLFPEGGNFTARRRARVIARLREKGLVDEAEQAEELRYVLPPKPGGVLAVLDAATDADVVWVAHTGTDTLYSVADVWRALPMDRLIRMRWWHVAAGDVPDGREERLEWVNAWWARIDDWIGEHRAD